MKAYITGTSGFLADRLARVLEKRGHEVKRISNHLDILDYKGLCNDIFRFNPDVIIHAAAIAGTTICDTYANLAVDINVTGTYNLAKIAKIAKAKIMYYGTTVSFDRDLDYITEDSELKPKTLYGSSKYAGEIIIKQMIPNNHIIIRPCFVYGPDDPHSIISLIIKAYLNDKPCLLLLDPDFKKDYMYVDEFNDGVVKLLEKGSLGEFNISLGQPRPIKDVISILAKYGIKPIIYLKSESDYLGHHIVSNEKLKGEIDWNPEITIEKGIEKVLKAKGLI